MLPFLAEQLQNPNWFQRLFHLCVKKNAIIEINNMFAGSDDIRKITHNEIESVMTSYKTDINSRQECLSFYDKYLLHAISDNELDELDMSILAYLQTTFNIPEERARQMREERTRDYYKKELLRLSGTKGISDEEVIELKNIQAKLLIPKKVVLKVHSDFARSLMNEYFKPIIESGLYSLEQEQGLREAMIDTRIDELGGISSSDDLIPDKNTNDKLARCRYQWLVQYGEIPVISVDINLHRNEKCYMVVAANLLEYRKVTRRVNYGGPAMRVKLAKGVYWRMGSVGVQRVSEDVLTKIDSGNLYVTNQRLIYTGTKKNSTIRFSQVLDFKHYKNGIEVEKESGKNPFFEFSHEVALFSAILARGISEACE